MILLTGSSGFIGTNIIKYFVKKKIKFHAVDLKKIIIYTLKILLD